MAVITKRDGAAESVQVTFETSELNLVARDFWSMLMNNPQRVEELASQVRGLIQTSNRIDLSDSELQLLANRVAMRINKDAEIARKYARPPEPDIPCPVCKRMISRTWDSFCSWNRLQVPSGSTIPDDHCAWCLQSVDSAPEDDGE